MLPRESNHKLLNYLKTILKKKDVIESLNEAKLLRESTDIRSPESGQARRNFEKILEEICVRHKFPVWTGSLVFERLIIEGLDTPIERYESIFSTCGLGVFDEDKELNPREKGWLYEVRPVKITFSPYASIDDIKKYVDIHADEIKKIQSTFKGGFAPIDGFYTRGNKKQEIYDYVFKNQHLTYESLTLSLNSKFNTTYGYDSVGRMVRRENQKRGYQREKRTN